LPSYARRPAEGRAQKQGKPTKFCPSSRHIARNKQQSLVPLITTSNRFDPLGYDALVLRSASHSVWVIRRTRLFVNVRLKIDVQKERIFSRFPFFIEHDSYKTKKYCVKETKTE
ncbi:unnamed protein product, partial [Didymodactylos carnosus]